MEINKDLKKIIKLYLKSKEDKDESEELSKLEKIVILLDRIKKKGTKITIDIEYFENIKKYVIDRISKIISKLLKKNSKIINNNIFNLIKEGDISTITETDNIYNFDIYDDEGMTPLHKCVKMGDATMLKEFLKKGEKIDLVNKNGHTLLEYACLEKDPNMILFLLNHGADMQKHLFFRKDSKFILNIPDIDTAIIIKLCLLIKEYENNIDLNFLLNYIDKDEKIGINDITFGEFIKNLTFFIGKLPIESQDSLIQIWKEELSYSLNNNMGCPNNYLELIVMNIIPFIKYPFNVTNRNLLTNELIILIKKMCLNNNYILDIDFKKSLINKIWIDYNEKISSDYIGVIINNIFSKIK